MRSTLRSLVRARGLAIVVVLTTAIGVAATTAVFSIVDAVLLKPLPFAEPGRLFVLSGLNPRRGIDGAAFSYPAFRELAGRARSLNGIAAIANERFTITGADPVEQAPAARVSPSFFDVLGVRAAIGRTFDADPGDPGDNARQDTRTVVLGHAFWLRRFNGDRRAVGATIVLNDAPFVVAGVLGAELPPPFSSVDIWATRPDAVSGFTPAQVEGGLGYLSAVARLAPGVDRDRAQAEMDTIAHGYAVAHPGNTDADPDATLQLVGVREQGSGPTRPTLLLLAAAVAAVLLTACANVANLLLVRAAARSHEAAVRSALGASRWALARWLCTEGLLLAAAGGIIGTLAAFWMLELAAPVLAALPRGAEIGVDARALAFSLIVTTLAGVGFGLAPLRRVVRQPAVDALRWGGRGVTGHRGAVGALIVGEVAVSLVLLVVAGLLLQGLVRMIARPVGFQADGLVTMRLSLPTSRYPDAAALRSFMARLTARLDATPGIASAAAAMVLPPDPNVMAPYQTGDGPQRPIGARPTGIWSAVTPRYFSTMGIGIVEGRGFTDNDNETSPLVTIVSESLARREWPRESAIGKRVIVGRQNGFAEIVGVARDVPNAGLAAAPRPAMYTPYPQRPWSAFGLVVRPAGGSALAIVSSVRAALAGVDRDQPITDVRLMDAALSGSIATARLTAQLLAAFALVALVMAAAGLYGVVAYSVEQRSREIGIRVALGADPRAVLRLVAIDGARFVGAGVIAGALGAVLATRAIRSQLFTVSPADPATYALVLVVFALSAGAACIIPARRALRVDPLTALRDE